MHKEYQKLLDIYHENKLSHAFLVETNNLDKAYDDTILFIKEIFNNDKISHLIDINSLPSLVIVKPDGKTIKKEQIDTLKDALKYKPVYTDKNIYIMVSPEKMNETSFNKMLKFLEEPEDDIIGIYISDNKNTIPSTIISRLEVIKILYEEEINYNEDINSLANIYFNKLNNKEDLICYNIEVVKTLETRENLIEFLKILLNLYVNKYENDKNNINLSNIILKYLQRASYNVNLNLLLDSLYLEMESNNGK